MRNSINISQSVWQSWFVSATLILALSLLIAITVQALDYADVVLLLTITFINWLVSVLIGLRKY